MTAGCPAEGRYASVGFRRYSSYFERVREVSLSPMEQVLSALGGLLLQAVPTLLLVMLLYFYLKKVYFAPMGRVLKERWEATEGARRLAQESFAKASEKAAQYENALRDARSEIYREQERARERMRQQQAEAVQQARRNADAAVKQAHEQIEAELALAKGALREQSGSLANNIVDTILHRRPA